LEKLDLPQPREKETRLTRDQKRALLAYRCVEGVTDDRDGYKIAVNDLGANILRSGLAAAMAALERRDGPGKALLLQHLASAGIPALSGATNLPKRVCELPVEKYMIATREMLAFVTWLKRAVQATFDS
jgi:CRISPR/Cas system CMR-associated protein Cmr5 small subunit